MCARSADGGVAPGPDLEPVLGRIDRLLEHRVRLAICVLLSRHDALSFSRLKQLLGETDGSLGAHLRKLEDEGYLTARKEFVARKPLTWYAQTAKGRTALREHARALEDLLVTRPRRQGRSKEPAAS